MYLLVLIEITMVIAVANGDDQNGMFVSGKPAVEYP